MGWSVHLGACQKCRVSGPRDLQNQNLCEPDPQEIPVHVKAVEAPLYTHCLICDVGIIIIRQLRKLMHGEGSL